MAFRCNTGNLTERRSAASPVWPTSRTLGFTCDLWTDPPGRTSEDFTHATDELVTVLEGQMEFVRG
jgi:hypothetical protein